MEGLVVFLVIISWIIKRAKKAGENVKDQDVFDKIADKLTTFAEKMDQDWSWDGKPKSESVKPEAAPAEVRQGESLWESSPRGTRTFAWEETGSLGYGTKEGMDTCDPTLGHERLWENWTQEEDEPVREAAPNAPLIFTEKALWQGVVMSEILARPSQRKWGKR